MIKSYIIQNCLQVEGPKETWSKLVPLPVLPSVTLTHYVQ